jgi:hypothetical protein
MADAANIATQIQGLFTGTLGDVYARFSDEDKASLGKYGQEIASLVVQVRTSKDSAEIAKSNRKIEAYSNAINLMADRYLGKLEDELQKAALEGLKTASIWALKILVAALV